MATAAQAIKRIANVTGLLPATVFRAARWLREADTSMWPQGTQGRGKAAHVEPCHLVNLALALAVAEPITFAPKIVARFRAMVPRPNTLTFRAPSDERPAELGKVSRMFFGEPQPNPCASPGQISVKGVFGGEGGLGGDLDRLVNLIATRFEDDRVCLLASGLRVRLTISGYTPSAEVSYFDGLERNERHSVTFVYYVKRGFLRSNDFDLMQSPPKAPIECVVTLSAALFSVLADLWDDTMQIKHCKPINLTVPGFATQPPQPGP